MQTTNAIMKLFIQCCMFVYILVYIIHTHANLFFINIKVTYLCSNFVIIIVCVPGCCFPLATQAIVLIGELIPFFILIPYGESKDKV